MTSVRGSLCARSSPALQRDAVESSHLQIGKGRGLALGPSASGFTAQRFPGLNPECLSFTVEERVLFVLFSQPTF